MKGAKGSEGVKGSEESKGGQREQRAKGSEVYSILGFRVPTTSVGTKGSKAYCILGFRVTTSVGERGEGE